TVPSSSDFISTVAKAPALSDVLQPTAKKSMAATMQSRVPLFMFLLKDYPSFRRRGRLPGSALLSRQRMLEPQRYAVQKAQLVHQPGQLVGDHQPAHKQQQDAAADLNRVQVTAKALVELQKLHDADGSQQKGDGQPGGIERQQQHTASDGRAVGGQRQHGRQNRSDARRPAKCEREPQQKSAQHARLFAGAAQVHIAIEPARQSRAQKADHRERKEVYRLQPGKQLLAAQERQQPQNQQNGADHHAGNRLQLGQSADQMQAEQDDQ